MAICSGFSSRSTVRHTSVSRRRGSEVLIRRCRLPRTAPPTRVAPTRTKLIGEQWGRFYSWLQGLRLVAMRSRQPHPNRPHSTKYSSTKYRLTRHLDGVDCVMNALETSVFRHDSARPKPRRLRCCAAGFTYPRHLRTGRTWLMQRRLIRSRPRCPSSFSESGGDFACPPDAHHESHQQQVAGDGGTFSTLPPALPSRKSAIENFPEKS